MSKCPFWSTNREKVECYSECPILGVESLEYGDEKCIFHECSEKSNINFGDIIKEEYNFLNLSVYNAEKLANY